MYLRLPVLLSSDNTTHAVEMPFNPSHIVCIEPDTEDNTCCYVVTTKEDYYVTLTVEQVEKKIHAFEQRSVIHEYFKSLKNGNS